MRVLKVTRTTSRDSVCRGAHANSRRREKNAADGMGYSIPCGEIWIALVLVMLCDEKAQAGLLGLSLRNRRHFLLLP
jgi:hypothetical protein